MRTSWVLCLHVDGQVGTALGQAHEAWGREDRACSQYTCKADLVAREVTKL